MRSKVFLKYQKKKGIDLREVSEVEIRNIQCPIQWIFNTRNQNFFYKWFILFNPLEIVGFFKYSPLIFLNPEYGYLETLKRTSRKFVTDKIVKHPLIILSHLLNCWHML